MELVIEELDKNTKIKLLQYLRYSIYEFGTVWKISIVYGMVQINVW